MMKIRRSWLKWLSLIIAVGIVSLSSLSVSANSHQRQNSSRMQVAIDFLDLIKGAVDYIQVSNISDEQEVALGKQTNEQVLSQYQLYNNVPIQEYVSSLGQELVSSSDSRDIPFVFQVVASDEVNAFATPGGFVYATTGLLKTAENRAQLASVMGHEIAHINERHGIKGLKQAVAAKGIASTVGVDSDVLAQMAYQLTVDLPRSRSFEYEADSSGLKILQQAGYPAQAFAEFLTKLQGGGGTPEFLRTHPTSQNRIDAISHTAATNQVDTNKGQDTAEYRNNVLARL